MLSLILLTASLSASIRSVSAAVTSTPSLQSTSSSSFNDNFDDGNYDGWNVVAGSWDVSSGSLHSIYTCGTKPLYVIVAGESQWADYDFSFDIKHIQGWDGGQAIFRYSGDSYYLLETHPNTYYGGLVRLYRINDTTGVHENLIERSWSIPANTWVRFKVHADGGQIQLFEVSGSGETEIFNITDPTPLLSGKIGFRVGSGAICPSEVAFDNVEVRTLAPNCVAPTGLNICDPQLQPGDILLETQTLGKILGGAVGSYWFHAGIYDEDPDGQGYVLEARGRHASIPIAEEVQRTHIEDTGFYSGADEVAVLRLKEDYPNSQSIIDGALAWVRDKADGENARYTANFTFDPVNFTGFLDPTNKQKTAEFYCSLFVWRACYEQGVDLDYPSGYLYHLVTTSSISTSPLIALLDAQVLPDDLYASAIGIPVVLPPKTDIIQGKTTQHTIVVLLSPADLRITDINGNVTGVDPDTGAIANEIPGAFYSGPDSEPEWISLTGVSALPEIIVLGDGSGEYTVAIQQSDGQTESADAFVWDTEPGQVDTFTSTDDDTGAIDLLPVQVANMVVIGGNVQL